MSNTVMWAHGNALTVETPDHVTQIRHQAWGTDLFFAPGNPKATWLHIPIPTPAIVNDGEAALNQVYLLFQVEGEEEAGNGRITALHVDDGAFRLQEFENISLDGNHRGGIDARNTFTLDKPQFVRFGIGVSFFFVPTASNNQQAVLRIAGAGADFFI